jgi:chemotaxis signal transduction protein
MSIRGLTLPLVDLPRLLGNRDVPNNEAMAIVLYDAPYPCALKVSKIERIEKTELEPQSLFKKSFIKGVLTLESEKILQLLNLDAILDAAFCGNEAAIEAAATNTRAQLDEAMRALDPGPAKVPEVVSQ